MGSLKMGQRPRVLLGATTWWPLSARLAMAFLRHGCDVSGVCPPGHPLSYVKGVSEVYPYRSINSLGSLRNAILSYKPDLIVPCDDGVVWQLHALHSNEASLRSIIEESLGPAEYYPIIRDRGTLLTRAWSLKLRVPETQIIKNIEDLDRWAHGFPAVLKLDGTFGGSGVSIVHSVAGAVDAYKKLAKPVSAGAMWKRLFVNRTPLAFWSWDRPDKPNISLQEYIPGRPANAMIACWKGEVLGIVMVEVLRAQGATGAATVVRVIKNDEMENACRVLAHNLQLNGFHGIDFMLAKNTGIPYLIELNPRCTQLGHLQLSSQGDLAGMIAEKLESPPDDQIDQTGCCQPGSTIAFFPQAFNWNPKSPYLRSGYHDVPWEEPELLRQLFRRSWPDRQILSRIYHFFRSTEVPKETNFE